MLMSKSAWKGFSGALLILIGVHTFFIFGTTDPTLKGESNYFSTLARLQTAADVKSPQIAFVGSSLTGRLPMASLDRKAINLGCDGGSSLDSLLLLTSGSFSIPPVVVIEANVLESDSLSLHGITQSAWFRCGRRFPLVSAAYRPSSLLFQRLKERGPRQEKQGEDTLSNWIRFTEVPRIPESLRESTAVPERKYSRVIELIMR